MDEKQAPKPSPRSGKHNTIRLKDALDQINSEINDKITNAQKTSEQKVDELNKKIDSLNNTIGELTAIIETLTDGLSGR